MVNRDRVFQAVVSAAILVLSAIACIYIAGMDNHPKPAGSDDWQKPAGYAYACNALHLFPDTTPVEVAVWLTDQRGIDPEQAIHAVHAGLDHDCAA